MPSSAQPSAQAPAGLRATARAGSNIAFIKYWGVSDPQLNLPLSNSISMTLADAYTTTSVQWEPEGKADEITIDGNLLDTGRAARISRHLDRLRAWADVGWRARVVSRNNFPMASGIASSASGFAALTVAGCAALGAALGAAQLSALARRGSGSACRSLFGGFVEWEKGHDDATSVARQIAPSGHWDLVDIVALVSTAAKAVSSESGHLLAAGSPFNAARIKQVEQWLTEVRAAISGRDIELLGTAIERDALAMHAVMMTSSPSLLYWQAGTLAVLHAVRRWRAEEGLPVYFTIDAGPNVHLICEAAHQRAVLDRLASIKEVVGTLVSPPGPGPQLLDSHLL